MNCQDITRFADTGHFSRLTEIERREAEAHALTCRHCAPVWAAHARLAELRIPQMPAELAMRCRTLAAVPASARSRSALRRWTLVSGLVALAAAAGLLTVRWGSVRTAEPSLAVAAPVATELATAEPVAPPAASDVIPTPPAPARITAVKPLASLPLLPIPDYHEADKKSASVRDLALQKAVERHPELVEGADIGGTFIVVMTMRSNGDVLDSSAQLIDSADPVELGKELGRKLGQSLPVDAINTSGSSYLQHFLVSDGRPLRARVMLTVTQVSNDYDPTRSAKRIEEIVRARYANLLLPMSGGQLNRLTLLLAEDGSIQLDDVEHLNLQSRESQSYLNGTNAGPRLAENIASRLGIDAGQLGLVGAVPIMDAVQAVVADANGNPAPNDMRMLLVNYAWPRRTTEQAPTFVKSGDPKAPKLDLVAALAIVKREIPDAFYVKKSAGTPTVVLNAKGEVVRSGRQRTQDGKEVSGILQSQPGSGLQTDYISVQTLRDETGATAEVWFAWEIPVAQASK